MGAVQLPSQGARFPLFFGQWKELPSLPSSPPESRWRPSGGNLEQGTGAFGLAASQARRTGLTQTVCPAKKNFQKATTTNFMMDLEVTFRQQVVQTVHRAATFDNLEKLRKLDQSKPEQQLGADAEKAKLLNSLSGTVVSFF